MADEPQPDQTPSDQLEDTPEETATVGQETVADANQNDVDDDSDASADDLADDESLRPRTVAMRNADLVGQLVLPYDAQRREGGLADLLHPQLSAATSGWLVLDLDEPLACDCVGRKSASCHGR